MIVEIEPLGADVEIASTEADLTALSQELVPTGPVGPAGEGADVSGISPITVNSSDEIGLDETALVPGSSNEILFNDGGTLGADSGLTWDGKTLSVQAQSGQTDPLLSLKHENGVENTLDTKIGSEDGIGASGSVNLHITGGDRIVLNAFSLDLRNLFRINNAPEYNVGRLAFGGGNKDNLTVTEGSSATGGRSIRYHASNPDADSKHIFSLGNDFRGYESTGSYDVLTLNYNGDASLNRSGSGVVLTSPDGSTTKRVYLANDGTLQTETP